MLPKPTKEFGISEIHRLQRLCTITQPCYASQQSKEFWEISALKVLLFRCIRSSVKQKSSRQNLNWKKPFINLLQWQHTSYFEYISLPFWATRKAFYFFAYCPFLNAWQHLRLMTLSIAVVWIHHNWMLIRCTRERLKKIRTLHSRESVSFNAALSLFIT